MEAWVAFALGGAFSVGISLEWQLKTLWPDEPGIPICHCGCQCSCDLGFLGALLTFVCIVLVLGVGVLSIVFWFWRQSVREVADTPRSPAKGKKGVFGSTGKLSLTG